MLLILKYIAKIQQINIILAGVLSICAETNYWPYVLQFMIEHNHSIICVGKRTTNNFLLVGQLLAQSVW